MSLRPPSSMLSEAVACVKVRLELGMLENKVCFSSLSDRIAVCLGVTDQGVCVSEDVRTQPSIAPTQSVAVC